MKFDSATFQRLFSPNSYKNLDVFVEQMPIRAGQASVIAGVICLMLGGLSVVYAVMQAGNLMTLRADILKAEALKPTVPVITKAAVSDEEVTTFVKRISEFYPQISFNASGNRIEMRAKDTDKYGAFREAVGHAFNGGKGWRLAIDNMCVGRECKNNTSVYGAFTVHRLRIDKAGG